MNYLTIEEQALHTTSQRFAEAPSVERLKSLLIYDPLTGSLTWIKSPRPGTPAGSEAGTRSIRGYRNVKIDGKMYKAHRLAWLYVHGTWPVGYIDHINGIGDDNRIANLRDVSPQVNAQNRKSVRANSSHKFMGASKYKFGWAAAIQVDGKRKSLGTFKTPEEAHQAYLIAKRELHEGCTI